MVYVHFPFGDNPSTWQEASPRHHVNEMKAKAVKKVPPFLIFNAEADLGLEHDGELFWKDLMDLGSPVEYRRIERSTHSTITRSDVVADHSIEFIGKILSEL